MASLIRFIDERGVIRWGTPEGPGAARPIEGGLLGSWRCGDFTVRVARVLAPSEPPNIFAIGRNYREHAKEMNAQARENEPLVFMKATTSVIGPDEAIVLPDAAPSEVDYEAELAIVIGREARNVSEERALEHVLGYTCGNDVSARDCQRNDKQWARAKSFDTFCPIGPVLVTADSIRPEHLRIRSILNGTVMQESNTTEMIFSPVALVSYLSRQFTLRPGTLILTGTPPGVGAARNPRVFLRPGDTVVIEIDGIGALSNFVRAAK